MKNKAFTLIELLAVIVILAIIALIAVPIVINIIDNAKNSSVIRSTELYLDAVELSIAREGLNNNQIEDGQYGIEEFTKVEVNGQAPSEGMLEITEGKITDYSLQIGEYVLNYDETKKKPVIGGSLRKAKFKPIVDLVGGMTAVQYINDNWTVVDGTKKNWYNYKTQEWANAVILETGVTKHIGDTVDVSSEVKGMFVYVPRYEYKIEGTYGTHLDGTEGTRELPGEIKINFVPKTKNGVNNEYRVHPAFTFGEEELNGIWVGKFETSHVTLSSSKTRDNLGCINEECLNSNGLRILPNVISLRYNNVSNTFFAVRSMSKSGNEFGLNSKNADTHMMKNSEWGAVAYLSQSKYGKYGNNKYNGAEKQVRMNNCIEYKTGIGADNQNDNKTASTCTTNTYETEKGQAASTTGNITGIYDMSGGSLEYVMGYLSGVSDTWGATSLSDYAGFTSAPEAKYFDSYINVDGITTCNGDVCYGHSLSETRNWYNNTFANLDSDRVWIIRNGWCNNTVYSGIFGQGNYFGIGEAVASFRVIITLVK